MFDLQHNTWTNIYIKVDIKQKSEKATWRLIWKGLYLYLSGDNVDMRAYIFIKLDESKSPCPMFNLCPTNWIGWFL